MCVYLLCVLYLILYINERGIAASQAWFHFYVLILELKLKSCKQQKHTQEPTYVPNIQYSEFAGLKRNVNCSEATLSCCWILGPFWLLTPLARPNKLLWVWGRAWQGVGEAEEDIGGMCQILLGWGECWFGLVFLSFSGLCFGLFGIFTTVALMSAGFHYYFLAERILS